MSTAVVPFRRRPQSGDVRWSREFGFVEIYDAEMGEWHQVARDAAPASWRQMANAAKRLERENR